MALPNIFTKTISNSIINRIECLTPETQALWGVMSVDQMLAHCNVTYEMAYENIHPEPNFILRLILKTFVKKRVVGENPYPKSNPTAPAFIIKGKRDFNLEKNRLISYINKTQELGEQHFDGKKSLSFGILNKTEWNNMFYKHLNHHLSQFGV